LLLLAPTLALAQPEVRYQGFLTDSGGDPINATVTMYFKLYGAETGGSPLFLRQIDDVSIVAGNFAVDIDLEASDLSQSDLWMTFALGDTDNELPRQTVASVPWAFQCGNAEVLDGRPAAEYQTRVATGCSPGQFIRQVQSDGSVICEDDDLGSAGGVNSLTAGDGLLGDVPAGAVTLDVNAGVGLTATADEVAVDFGGSGALDEVARSDHDHVGAYVPVGNLSCPLGNKVSGLDTGLGDVVCGFDADSTYSVVPGGNLIIGGPQNDQFDLAPSLNVPGSFSADRYVLGALRTGHYSINPSDFDPEDSDYPDYIGPGHSAGVLSNPGVVEVLAPVNLPHGAAVNQVVVNYMTLEDVDGLYCYLTVIETALSSTAFEWGDQVLVASSGPASFSFTTDDHVVDNSRYQYVASCRLDDTGSPSVYLYGYTITYQYDELL